MTEVKKEKRKIKNGEYYTLISATLLFRVAFYAVITYIIERLSDLDKKNTFFFEGINEISGDVELITVNETNYVENFNFYVSDLGFGDFLLFALLACIIINYHFKEKERFLKIISVGFTGLFASLVSRLFMLLFNQSYNGMAFSPAVTVLKPLAIYIIPIGFIYFFIFTLSVKNIGLYLKISLLRLSSIISIICLFLLTWGVVAAIITYEKALFDLLYNAFPSNMPVLQFEAELERIEKYKDYIMYFSFAVDSLFITVVTLCYYRGAKNIKEVQS